MAGRVLNALLMLAGLTLYHLRLAALVRWLGRNHPKVLLYHECADTETPFTAELNCTTPPALFGAHLDYLARHYNVISVEELVAGRTLPGAVAITFDDGYRSVYTGALPALRQRGMPATVYLIADVVDNRALVWVNELNWLLRTPGGDATRLAARQLGLPEDSPAAAIVDHCRVHYNPEMVGDLLARLRALPASEPPTDRLYLNAADIAEMAAARITFGNHTVTHPNLERLDEQAQAREIGDAQHMLSSRFSLIASLAYPFGHHGATTAAIARQLGLVSVAEVGGLNRRSEPGRIGRVHLSGEGLPELFARMEVVEPIKGLLRDLRRPAPRRASA